MRHRLVLVAAVAMLGGLTLSGCQRDPEVAARVDGEVITQAQVEQIFDDSTPTGIKPTADQPALHVITRQDVVASLVMDKLCRKVQQAEGFPVPPVTGADMAQLYDVAPDSPFAVQEAKTRACLAGAGAGSTPAVPTDAEAQDIYQRALVAGIKLAGPYSEVKNTIAKDEGVQQYIGYRHSIERVINAGTVDLSPRYRGLDLALDINSSVPLIVSPLGQRGSDALQH